MANPQSPADRLHAQHLSAIANLTDYQIGHMWAAENNRKPGTLMDKSRDWRLRQPKSLSDFAEMMDAIGYRVELVKK